MSKNNLIREEENEQQKKAPAPRFKRKTGKISKMTKKDAKPVLESNKNIMNFLSKKPSEADI